MYELVFPQPEEFKIRYDKSSFPILDKKLSKLFSLDIKSSSKGIKGFKHHLDLKEFILQLQHRIVDSAKSYILMQHFYDLGIPDEEWHISPGRSGSSVEYFPHFKPIHFEIKDWFDYYSDVFYYKSFSFLDIVAQIFNIYYNLDIEESKVSFNKFVDNIKEKDNELFVKLSNIQSRPVFQQASKIRNSATHRCSPSTVGMVISATSNGWAFGIRDYLPSLVINDIAGKLISILEEIIDLMLEYFSI
jgi:hypothetical protein